MAGSELVGDIEWKYVEELFSKSVPAVLYRYHPDAVYADAFEKRIAERLGVKYAHLLSSGTAAIETALWAGGVLPGDEVITTAYTFVAPVEAAIRLGATPVCVDIDETFNMNVSAVAAAITEKTKAICAVPMWGACDMDGLTALCKERDIVLIEDSAQALSATYKGKPVGTFGEVGSFSLDAGKTLTAGEGGFIVTNSKEGYERAASYGDHGHLHQTDRPRGQDGVHHPGMNYRVSELTAAIALGQLDQLEDILARQRKRYTRLVQMIGGLSGITVRQSSDPEGELCDTLILTFNDKVIARTIAEKLQATGVGTKILPEAFNWHFAGSWDYIWRTIPESADHIARVENWKQTRQLLERSIALPVSVHENPEWEQKVLMVLGTGA